MSNDVINALKRLERAGSENSRATEKLQEAARVVGHALIERLEDAPCILAPLALRTNGLGDRILYLEVAYDEDPTVARLMCSVLHPYEVDKDASAYLPAREVALDFASLIAGGWLDRQADAVEAATAKAEQATAALEAARV